MKLNNDKYCLPQLSILKQVMMTSLSLCCTSTLPRTLSWLITEVAIFASPLFLLVEVSSIQHYLLEGSGWSPHLNDEKTTKKMNNQWKMEMNHLPLLFIYLVPLFPFSPHNLHTFNLPCVPSRRGPHRDLCCPPFPLLLHVQSFTLTIHISEKTTLIPNLIRISSATRINQYLLLLWC